MYSATSDVFPYPAGATIKVIPACPISTLSKISFREMKFGGSTGGKVRERLAAAITLDCATPSLATPKGDALGLVMASRNHPIGVRRAGEIRG